MIKTNIKLTLLTSIIFFQLSSSAFSMDTIEENKNNSSISIRLKNESSPLEVPIGSIIAFAGDKEPEGWLMCDGLQYSSKEYPKLYEIIKTKYVPKEIRFNILDHNESNNDKLFCVPDLRGRVLVGVDNGSNRVTSNNMLGETGGEEKHALTVDEMPKHNHKMFDSIANTSTSLPITASISGRNPNLQLFGFTEESGSNQPHNNMQPYLVSNYIIKHGNINDENLKLINEEKIFSTLKARYGIVNYSKDDWEPYTNTSWAPVLFDYFTGDERLKGNLSIIEIPEDGVYSLYALTRWSARNGPSLPETAIAFNTVDNVDYNFSRNTIPPGTESTHSISRVTRLKKGEKVMVSIKGDANTRRFLGHFGLYIEKIN